MATRILFTGAAGRVGREAIAKLKRAAPEAFSIRACCRDGEFSAKADALRSIGADEVVDFNFEDPTTFENALDNVHQIYHCSPDPANISLELAQQQMEFSRAIKTSESRDQISLIVRLSCIGVNTLGHSYTDNDLNSGTPKMNTRVPHIIRTYATIERLLMETGVPVTSLRGGFFMNHMIKGDATRILGQETIPQQDSSGPEYTQGNSFVLPFGEKRRAEISAVDIGEAVANIFLDEKYHGGGVKVGKSSHAGQLYTLTGREALSMHDIACCLRRVTDSQNIQYCPATDGGKAFAQQIGETRWHFLKWLMFDSKRIAERGLSSDLHEEFELGGHRYVHAGDLCGPGVTLAEFCSNDIVGLLGREQLSYFDHMTKTDCSGQTGLQSLQNGDELPNELTFSRMVNARQQENCRAGTVRQTAAVKQDCSVSKQAKKCNFAPSTYVENY